MNIAAESAARNAVGPIGLAALAVSAMIMTRPTAAQVTEPVVVDHSEPPHESNSEPESVVRVGEIVVVGSPDADTIVAQIRALDFAQCGWTTGHLTLYVHIREGVVSLDDQYKVTCPMAVVASGTYIGDADVMIPLDFSARP